MIYQFGWVDKPDEVDAVLSTMRHPVFCCAAGPIRDSGKGKIVLLHKAVEQVLGTFPVHVQDIGDCFVAGTQVSGEVTKAIEDVEIGDRVWTAEGRLTRVVSRRVRQTMKPLVRVSVTGGLPLTCTADHRVLAYRMKRVSGKRVTAAYYQRARHGAIGVPCAAVTQCYEGREAQWVKAGDLCDTDYLLSPTKVETLPVPQSPKGLLATAGGWFAIGFFLGNGYAGGGTVELAVSDEAVSGRLERALTQCGFRPKRSEYREGCGAWRIRVHSTELVRWLRSELYRDDAKLFPVWAIGNTAFFEGLCAADGHVAGRRHTLDSTSHSIIHGALATVTMAGYEPTVCEVVRSNGTYANAKPLFRVIWRDNKQKSLLWRDERFVCRPVRRVEYLEGPATVYDIGVADPSHSFLANGHAVHNCVSHGFGLGVDVVACVEIVIKGEREEYKHEAATEAIYGGSRVEVGGGQLGNDDGSVGAWAAKFIQDWGILARTKYINGQEYDLGSYSGQRAKEWGRKGVPDILEDDAREHPIKTASLTRTYEEARDAIANGFPVPVCSNQGFEGMKRDGDGFASPRGSWGHCMLFCAVDDEYKRPGLLCCNSWGPDWISGPKRHGQPDGSFWVDADVADKMLRQGDSFALSGFEGYPSQELDHVLI